jgi:hypothetical protein
VVALPVDFETWLIVAFAEPADTTNGRRSRGRDHYEIIARRRGQAKLLAAST